MLAGSRIGLHRRKGLGAVPLRVVDDAGAVGAQVDVGRPEARQVLHDLSVARSAAPASSVRLSGSTVKTLISVAWEQFWSMRGHRSPPCQVPYIIDRTRCKVPVMAHRKPRPRSGYLVKRVQQSLRRRCDAALRPTGLSMAQYAALRALADHPYASASELARLCFVTRQSAQDLLAGLRTAGLVKDVEKVRVGRAERWN